MRNLSPQELQTWLASNQPAPVLLDVREGWEYATAHLAGSLHIPMNQVPQSLAQLSPQQDIVVICHHGMRSMQVAMFLERSGFNAVSNLTGGIDAWSRLVDPSVARY